MALKPYYEHGGATIYHGDCREVLPQLESAFVDLVIADPPYGTTNLDWDVRDLAWLELCARSLRPEGTVWCFGAMKMFMAQGAAMEALGWTVAQDLVWQKHNGSNFHSDRFRRVHEHVVHLFRGRWDAVFKDPVKVADGRARQVRRKKRPAHMGEIGDQHVYTSVDGGPRFELSVIEVRSCHGYAEHPTQKPIGILSPLITYSCVRDGVVLDPTMGAGSTLVASKQAGRRSIGIELDERFCEVAARRLSQEMVLGG